MIPVSQPTLGAAERKFLNRCLDNNELTYGSTVRSFEKALAEYLGVRHVVTTSSGTTALHLALVSLGLKRGDEVLVPDLSFVATANAVFYTGARPVLVDVDPRTWCMDPADAAEKVTARTRAILPVHLYGVPCDMDALRELASIHALHVVEDAAEGLGGTYDGRDLGTLGVAGTFSFYGNKVLTTGEGGAVSTDDDELAGRLFLLRGQAMDPQRRYYHPEIGFNYRMTALQAAIGCGQMMRLDQMLQRRRDLIRLYDDRLRAYAHAPVAHAPARAGTRNAPWLYTLELQEGVDRDAVATALATRGIETRPAFVPMHRLPMYRHTDRTFPHASRIGDCGLSLPTFPDLTFQQVDEICDAVIQVLTSKEVACRTR